MKVTIHDVGHGLCISLIHQNGNVMLWDCGHQDNCRPSEFLPSLGVTRIDRFFVTNYDEDHISDLPNLLERVYIRSLHRNKSISAEQLRQLKLQGGPISPAMASMLDMIDSYTGGPLDPAPAFPGIHFTPFRNSYSEKFPDTNNISLVTFLNCNGTKFIIPGDIEKKGWQELLGRPDFTSELAGVNVFVASHHGREDGYCEDVFDICKPEVVVFSDSPVKHATQEMTQTYANHASGITFNRAARYVLSTRNDGSLTWTL
jgi:beta-lactamase superfamily II metal-dependent hydrolase